MRNLWIHSAALFYHQVEVKHVEDARFAYNKLSSLRGRLKTQAKKKGLDL